MKFTFAFMFSRLPYFLRLIIFWLFIFTSFRFFFIAFNPDITFHTPLPVILESFISGFRLDLSTIAYLATPVWLLWVLYLVTKKEVFNQINTWFHYFLLFSLCTLYVGSIKMYHEWNALLTYSIFDYLVDPGEVISFVSYAELSVLVVFLLIYLAGSIFIFKKLLSRFTFLSGPVWRKIMLPFLVPFAMAFFARGGLQLAPINESSAYFTDQPFFNSVAVNPFWYFIHSYFERDPVDNAYHFMDDQEAERRTHYLLSAPDSTGEHILRVDHPNVVLIVLESWTADIIESLGGEPGITSHFDSLRREGLLFTQIYNSGSRTEHGLVSVLSGYPPPPKISIITKPNKSQRLHNLNSVLTDHGYSSSFYYGGEIGFVNMKSFLLNAHFQKIIDRHDFTKSQCNSKWGAHDMYVLDKQLNEVKTQKEPFFSVVLTLSSHEPFDVPIPTPYKSTDESDKFRSAAYYADQCLGQYFAEAKKQPWYDHTLFILIADHGHRLPKNTDTNAPPSKHIPLLVMGGALKEEYRGVTNDVLGNQHDLVATLLNQLGDKTSFFPRSKDLLNRGTKHFAYYVNNNVLGWITPEQNLIYDWTSKETRKGNISPSASVNDSLLQDAKAYVQTHYGEYLKY